VARLVLKPGTLQNEYAALWNAFQEYAKGVGTASKAYFPSGFHADSLAGDVRACEVTGTFHFVGWPYRTGTAGTTRSRVVDIVAAGCDRYDCTSGELVHSTTQISYVRCLEGKPKGGAALQLHYDFHRGQGPRHPLFHAQVGPVEFDERQLKDLRVTPASVTPASNALHGVRIPTPLIGLLGLLLGLAADHWDDDRFSGFLNTLRKLKVLELPAACKDLLNSVRMPGASMQSHHWYGFGYAT